MPTQNIFKGRKAYPKFFPEEILFFLVLPFFCLFFYEGNYRLIFSRHIFLISETINGYFISIKYELFRVFWVRASPNILWSLRIVPTPRPATR
jgi:hypothetical protein